MPTIRALAKSMDYPSAAPHVFTGVESIYPHLARLSGAAPDTPSKRPRKAPSTSQTPTSTITDTRMLALIAVVFLYVLARMTDQEITPELYQEWQENTLSTLLELPAAQNIAYEELLPEVVQLRDMAPVEGWLQMEWCLNVVPAYDIDRMEDIKTTGSDAPTVKGKRKRSKEGANDYIGLATMMQDATDYLSQHQREDYKRWKANIMARVQQIETQ